MSTLLAVPLYTTNSPGAAITALISFRTSSLPVPFPLVQVSVAWPVPVTELMAPEGLDGANKVPPVAAR